MDILGIGPLELIMILIIALAIFGPERLPEMGAKLGRSLRNMRHATREFSREIDGARQTLEEIPAPLTEASQAASALSQAVSDPSRLIRDSVMRAYADDGSTAEAEADQPEAETASAQIQPAQAEASAVADLPFDAPEAIDLSAGTLAVADDRSAAPADEPETSDAPALASDEMRVAPDPLVAPALPAERLYGRLEQAIAPEAEI